MAVESGQNGVLSAPLPAGGAPRALDLTNPRDMAALRTALSQWPKRFGDIDAATKAVMVETLKAASHGEDAIEAIKTLAKMEELNQREELRILDALLGKGSTTQVTNVQVNNNNTVRLQPITLDEKDG